MLESQLNCALDCSQRCNELEVKSLLRDITKRSTLGFATENNQKRKDLMLEIKKDFSKILDGTITSTKF